MLLPLHFQLLYPCSYHGRRSPEVMSKSLRGEVDVVDGEQGELRAAALAAALRREVEIVDDEEGEFRAAALAADASNVGGVNARQVSMVTTSANALEAAENGDNLMVLVAVVFLRL